MVKNRISILDGFRAMAIFFVLLFHYFSRWIPPKNDVSLYPYNDEYNYFGYGFLGVQFFFIISGFVIFFTLENTQNFGMFWKKRLIRLLPALIFATIITYIIISVFDTNNLFPYSHEVKNFIPSLTFISPSIFNNFSSELNMDYINGSYWSLWPEIQFYVFASCIFFFNREKFVVYFMSLSIMLILINYFVMFQYDNHHYQWLSENVLNIYHQWIQDGFNLLKFLPFFSIGMLFYVLFRSKQKDTKISNFEKISLVILLVFPIYVAANNELRLIYFGMFLLFFGFIYLPKSLSFFENKTISKIGESSYFLYLIHEIIGVFIIYTFGKYFLPYGYILPLLLIFSLTFLSILFTQKIDKKLNKWLKRRANAFKILKL